MGFPNSLLIMMTETDLKETGSEPIWRAVVALRPKRRFRNEPEPAIVNALPIPAVSPLPRRSRMKRSGRMHLRWRISPHVADQIASVPPTTVSLLSKAFVRFGKAQNGQPTQVAV